MRLLVVALLLLAPSALASHAFEARSGVIDLSCHSLTVNVFVTRTGFGCSESRFFPLEPASGDYVADLSWVRTQEHHDISACLTVHRLVATAPTGDTVWVAVASSCAQATEGPLTLRVPASHEDGRIVLTVDFAPPSRRLTASYNCCVEQSVAYTLRHEA